MTHSFAPYARFLDRLQNVRGPNSGGYLSATCPAREHDQARLSLWVRGDKLLFGCYAGCDKVTILQTLGLKWTDCFPKRDSVREQRRIVAWYSYRDERGCLLFEAVRFEPGRDGRKKDLFYRRKSDDGFSWTWNIQGVRRVLYNLPELVAQPQKPLIVVEGEAKVERLRKLGLLATCCPCGARAWRTEYGEWLRGRCVAVLPDNNDTGAKYAETILSSAIVWGAASVRLVTLPCLAPDDDVCDWLDLFGQDATEGQQAALLVEAIRAAPEYRLQRREVGKA